MFYLKDELEEREMKNVTDSQGISGKGLKRVNMIIFSAIRKSVCCSCLGIRNVLQSL